MARSFGFAQEAAGSGDFFDAIEWLRVVEVVDGGLPVEWERTREYWVDRQRSALASFAARAIPTGDGVWERGKRSVVR